MYCLNQSISNYKKEPGKFRSDVSTIRALSRSLIHSRRSLAVADGLFLAFLLAPAVHMKERRVTARIEGRPGQ